MTVNLRCRSPNGQLTFQGLSAEMTVREFLELLGARSGLPCESLEILHGFPPKPVQLPSNLDTSKLSELGLANGDMFTLKSALTVARVARVEQSVHQSLALSEQAPKQGLAASLVEDDDPELARALAASLERPVTVSCQSAPSTSTYKSQGSLTGGEAVKGLHNDIALPNAATSKASVAAPAASNIDLADGTCVTRRIIDSDNSCLFNAVGYVMEHSRMKARELRRVIANAVSADPVTYNNGFLGKENDEYCRWILMDQNWGGAIELSILCHHYKVQIAAYDIRTKRCDVYGADAGYAERVMLLYDGLHYDAMAVAAFRDAPEDLDVTIFNPASRDGSMIMDGAARLVAAAHSARQFTDTANFKLRCGVCQIGIKGEKEAVEHAAKTGHTNFSEY
ncbi:hypothetical protein CEUSTIGMA_g6478.t1 [Chlamydomonas eustigma]|uniref:Ubiquitin thioesterase OTU n=1 Tax=Chlamydomonas eustigma TaxID=1157962 RepID=A0A250X7I1_9CHLO|nr:hypothetical protein CEUSTIGMA_g6478.t1 [Chlamydomonas eustigma]|eukprot:GAX79038.1 hypothetical protein CEUSTIGMA_g6478.t1 [Chlamydomonas eustigma]